jgi:organic radical activating enzyme
VKKIIRIRQSDADVFNLTWIINDICPNQCVYCPPYLHSGSNHHYDWNNARQFIKELIVRYKKIHCSIAGGEPTMSPFLPELIDILHEAGSKIYITSNGYKSVEYWRNLAPKLTWVGLSYHPQYPSERYFENLRAISQYTRADARVMMLSSHWQQCVAVYEQLIKNDSHGTSAVRINNWLGDNNNGSDYYTEEQLRWFNDVAAAKPRNIYKHLDPKTIGYISTRAYFDDGSEIIIRDATHYINNRQTNFKGYTCEIGLKSLFVGTDGDIKRGNCLQGGTIGNINEPNKIEWPTEAVTCSYDYCTCATDVRIDKWIS